MYKKLLLAAALGAASSFSSADDASNICWQFPAAVKQWNVLRNATVDEVDDAINLIPTKVDRSIGIAKLALDPEKFTTFKVYYRAEGFKTAKTTGQLFFASEKSPKIQAQHCFRLPSLITDGQKHVLTLQLNKQPQYKMWCGNGKITVLRLDIADQYPGDVYIEKIELISGNAPAVAAAGKTQQPLVWEFAGGIGDWNKSEKLSASCQDGVLMLKTSAKDSRIINRKCQFSGDLYTQIRITYRAEGFAGRTSGQVFYTSDQLKNFAYKNRTVLPSLQVNGQWQTLTVKAPWQAAETVKSIRLDMVDQHPGTVWIKKIELLP